MQIAMDMQIIVQKLDKLDKLDVMESHMATLMSSFTEMKKRY